MGQNLRGTEKIKFDLVEKYENALFFHHKPVIDRFLGVYGLDLNLVITQSDVKLSLHTAQASYNPLNRAAVICHGLSFRYAYFLCFIPYFICHFC